MHTTDGIPHRTGRGTLDLLGKTRQDVLSEGDIGGTRLGSASNQDVGQQIVEIRVEGGIAGGDVHKGDQALAIAMKCLISGVRIIVGLEPIAVQGDLHQHHDQGLARQWLGGIQPRQKSSTVATVRSRQCRAQGLIAPQQGQQQIAAVGGR